MHTRNLFSRYIKDEAYAHTRVYTWREMEQI